MALTSKEISELKAQLLEQTKSLPEDKKARARAQIDSLSPEAMESLVEEQKSKYSQKIFRLLVSGEIPSIKVGENPSAVAVLSTQSISEGHTLVIPKSLASSPKSIPNEAFVLAEELSKKISSSLKAKEVRIETEVAFGEAIINLIPIYAHPLTLKSPKTSRSLEDLEQTKKSIEVIRLDKKPEQIKIESPRTEVIKRNRRIP